MNCRVNAVLPLVVATISACFWVGCGTEDEVPPEIADFELVSSDGTIVPFRRGEPVDCETASGKAGSGGTFLNSGFLRICETGFHMVLELRFTCVSGEETSVIHTEGVITAGRYSQADGYLSLIAEEPIGSIHALGTATLEGDALTLVVAESARAEIGQDILSFKRWLVPKPGDAFTCGWAETALRPRMPLASDGPGE